jgi:hypothetical protein
MDRWFVWTATKMEIDIHNIFIKLIKINKNKRKQKEGKNKDSRNKVKDSRNIK